MNALPAEKLAEVIELHAQGATRREIQAKTGVHRDTVRVAIERIAADRRHLLAKLTETKDHLRATYGIDLMDYEPFLEAIASLQFSCPVHPNADIETGFDHDKATGCLRCNDPLFKHHEGMKRHHARRKAEGRPILPP